MKIGDIIDGREVQGILTDCEGRELPLFWAYPVVFACSYCHHAFRSYKEKDTDLGHMSLYHSVKEPITGWSGCKRCRAREEK